MYAYVHVCCTCYNVSVIRVNKFVQRGGWEAEDPNKVKSALTRKCNHGRAFKNNKNPL